MSIALILPEGFQEENFLAWGMKIAASRDVALVVFDLKSSKKTSVTEVDWQAGDSQVGDSPTELTQVLREQHASAPSKPAECRLIQICGSLNSDEVLAEIQKCSPSFLVLPRHRGSKSTSADFTLQRDLFLSSACTTLQLCLGAGEPLHCKRILVPTRGSRNTAEALRLATDLAEASEGQVEALYLQEDVDESAALVGKRMIEQLVRRYADDEESRVATRSVVCDDVIAGIKKEANERSDVLVLGASYHSVVHRFLFSSITEKVVSSDILPTVIIIRPAAPWRSRIVAASRRMVSDIVPQLDRESRVDLVERVHRSSRWDVDFIALICLSTLIAGLGLLQNSAAVVIGAMLVAPLMTPLLGAGLALVQGNRLLAQCSAGAVVRGFLVALGIGALLGLVMGPEAPTTEMLARCSPGVADLVIAFASGLAAAYASGRPNLYAALPGVAIAAALVPPIATAGILLAVGRTELAFGAGLLFLTNIIAIVLGAACSLWAVGIRSDHAHSLMSSWAPRALLALGIMMAGLGVYESSSPVTLTGEFKKAVTKRIEQASTSKLLDMNLTRSSDGQELQLLIAAAAQADQSLLDDLAAIASEEFNRPTGIRIETRLTQSVGAQSSEAIEANPSEEKLEMRTQPLSR
ncbi:DUF389 domain-containing protein [Adhaeretor mobilis]|uniref:Universal stress protein family protein n=1 Tax=Adhaeretor mobilis TaxID=1930276 RepID=A0A517MY67_9BACT|nr:DUF389 domain-containing protein [Adhaeretor mobilis]QDS99814.1 Universal stress protein family protein [Adhaeretor mobilis]